jgi:nucleoside 2-deoxyribosyltransferase
MPDPNIIAAAASLIHKCAICGTQLRDRWKIAGRASYEAKCLICGKYCITPNGERVARGLGEVAYLLSGVLRNSSDNGVELEVNGSNMEQLLSRAKRPDTPLQLLDRLLLDISRKPGRFDEPRVISLYDYAKYFLQGTSEFVELFEMLKQFRYLQAISVEQEQASVNSWIAIEGWKRVDELRQRVVASQQAFVAMSFAAEMTKAYDVGIRVALEACGYQPMRVDRKEHNDKIDDVIVAELRRSSLVVADFTHHRNGVYFEAGFARGANIPLIWLCREDHLSHAHFDTRQYNHIDWKTAEELAARLEARIRATLPIYDTAGTHDIR